MPELSGRHKRQKALLDVIKTADFVEDEDVVDFAMNLDKLTDTEIADLEGWVQYCQDIGTRIGYMVSTMGHDIHGSVAFRDRPDEGFSPRTHGYAEFKKEVSRV